MVESNENPVEAGQFLGDDGTFQDGWQGLAFPDDTDPHKTDPTLANIKDFRSMAKMVVSSQKTIGKLSGGREFAVLPNEQSDEKELNEYHTKIGRPDAAEGYLLSELSLPEGVSKDDKFASHMSKVLFDVGAPKAMGMKIVNGYLEYMKTSLEAAAIQDKLDDQEANKQLRGILGAAYDEKMKDAAMAIRAFGSSINAAEAEEMIKELPYDSFASQLLASVGAIIREKGLKGAPTPVEGELTPANANAEINKIMNDPYYLTDRPQAKDAQGNFLHPANKQYHDELIQKVAKLTELAISKGGG